MCNKKSVTAVPGEAAVTPNKHDEKLMYFTSATD